MKLLFQILIPAFLITFLSCKVAEQPDQTAIVQDTLQLEVDTLEIAEDESEDLRIYRGEQTRDFELIHTKLEVSFDWENEKMFGTATLIVRPYFYEQSLLELDAIAFNIEQVSILKGMERVIPQYGYNGEKLSMALDKTYNRDQEISVQIKYNVTPNNPPGDIDFENDKKGLYFINPSGEIEGKPQQIWTHGETSDNSKWFPTIDAPNQKSTQEMFITVDDEFVTLSNGQLVYSRTNQDSTRTDYWRMDKPHAPYLFMMAIGDFAVVKDLWNEMEVSYYVGQDYEKYARDIFGNTPEMIEYFSQLLQTPYPWSKYSQIVVEDFISGAMENTTASVFMEDLHVNSRELIDYDWDDIIAHELFHQWFGNLVTCESWANLPLNESFATYGEYLWKNHKYGRYEADYHLYQELQSYLQEAEIKKADLIRFDYLEEDDMFDNHSYAKGGLILHMLRNYIGDEAFFKALENYLKSHAFGKAEIHELRLAFEKVTGQDLNWFFNQWFLDAGHPVLRVQQEYDSASSNFKLKVWQEQNADLFPVYKIPMTLDLWVGGINNQYLIDVERPYQEFEFEGVVAPDLILFDSEHLVVGEILHNKSVEQLFFQYGKYRENVIARYDAFQQLLENEAIEVVRAIITEALDDPFWVIREEALLALEKDTTGLFEDLERKVVDIANSDNKSLVKAAAIGVLAEYDSLRFKNIFRDNIFDSSYAVAGNALYAYLQTESPDISAILDSLENEDNFSITSSMADYFIMQQDFTKYEWFESKLKKYSGSDLWYFIRLFGMYLIAAPEDVLNRGIQELAWLGENHPQFFNRLSAYQSLQLLSDFEGVDRILEELKRKEKDPRILDYYD